MKSFHVFGLLLLCILTLSVKAQVKVVNTGDLVQQIGGEISIKGDYIHHSADVFRNYGKVRLSGNLYSEYPLVFSEAPSDSTGWLIMEGDSLQMFYTQKGLLIPTLSIKNKQGVKLVDSLRVYHSIRFKSGNLFLDQGVLWLGRSNSESTKKGQGMLIDEQENHRIIGSRDSRVVRLDGGTQDTLQFGKLGISLKYSGSSDLMLQRHFGGLEGPGAGHFSTYYNLVVAQSEFSSEEPFFVQLDKARFYRSDFDSLQAKEARNLSIDEMHLWLSRDNGKVWRIWSDHKPLVRQGFYELQALGDSVLMNPSDTLIVAIGPADCAFPPAVELGDSVQYICLQNSSLLLDGRVDTSGQIAYKNAQIKWFLRDTLIEAHSLTVSDTGLYTVEVTLNNGCRGTDRVYVKAVEPPLSDFEMSWNQMPSVKPDQITVKAGDTINFLSLSKSRNDELNFEIDHFWNFGDKYDSLIVSEEESPVYSYRREGIFDVSLLITNTISCTDTVKKQVRIFPEQMAFISGPEKICMEDSAVWQSISQNQLIPVFSSYFRSFTNWEVGIYDSTLHWSLLKDGILIDEKQSKSYGFKFKEPGSYELIFQLYVKGLERPYQVTRKFEIKPVPSFELELSPVCQGNPLSYSLILPDTLNADSLTFEWDFYENKLTFNEQNPLIIFEIPNEYPFTLTITNAEDCQVSQHYIAEVYPQVSFNIQIDGNRCAEEELEFSSLINQSATNAYKQTVSYKYQWNFGDGTFSQDSIAFHQYSVQKKSTFPVTLILTSGIQVNGQFNTICETILENEITIEPKPEVDMSIQIENDCVQNGDSVAVIGKVNNPENGMTYLWNSQHEGSAFRQFYQAGKHVIELEAVNEENCSQVFRKEIELFKSPSAILKDTTSAQPFISLDVKNYDHDFPLGSSFQWYKNDALLIDEINETIAIEESGNYKVNILTPQGCQSFSNTVSVRFTRDETQLCNSLPEPTSWQEEIQFCKMTELNAYVKGAAYEWSTGETTAAITVYESGLYEVIITDTLFCENIKKVEATKKESPVIEWPDFLTACSGETIQLEGPYGDFTYHWSDNSTNRILEVETSGWYTLQVENSEGCVTTDSLEVVFFEPLSLDLRDTVSCGPLWVGTEVTADQYHWSTGETSPSLFIEETGQYILTISKNGCSVSDTVQVTIVPEFSIDLGPDQFICSGETWTLDAGISNASYLWSDGSTSQTITAASGGRYWVEVTNDLGCSAYDEFLLDVEEPLAVDLGDDRPICEGDYVLLNASLTIPATYQWVHNGEIISTNPSIEVDKSGTYKVTVTSVGQGCSVSDEVTLLLEDDKVTADFIVMTTVNVGDLMQFVQLSYDNPNEYFWDFGNGQTSFLESPVISYEQAGEYLVRLTVSNGVCTDEMTRLIKVLPGSSAPLMRFAGANTFIEIDRLELYPNPNQGYFTFSVDLSRLATMEVGLLSLDGILLQSYTLHVKEMDYEFDISSLPGGIYLLKVNIEGQLKVFRIIKQ